jgi:hypothetical protein
MLGSEIIEKFELWTDDTTELSTDQELSLASEKAKDIYTECVWEFLRKNAIGSFSGGYIDLATVAPDFVFPMANYSEDESYSSPTIPVVFVGGTVPYKIIPMGLRKQHQGQNVCWVDLVQKRISFADSTAAGTFDFDYQYAPADITEATTSAVPSSYALIIVYAMLIDDDVIQKTEKARSNIVENTRQYQRIMSNLKSYNAKFILQQ